MIGTEQNRQERQPLRSGLARMVRLGCLWVACLTSAATHADLRIVVDVSQPAFDNLKLHGSAVEFLARQLPDNARAGLWSYSELTQELVAYGQTDPVWKQMTAIHGRNLNPGSQVSNPTLALQTATWDREQIDRSMSHVVWITSGRMQFGESESEQANAREVLLNTWAAKLRQQRVQVHVALINNLDSVAPNDLDFLRQVAQLSGGLFKQVTAVDQVQQLLLDVVALMQAGVQVKPDRTGRFQVAAQAESLNALWVQHPTQSPVLIDPTGKRLSRESTLQSGRWVVADDFEMVTLTSPRPGWWQFEGVPPDRLTVFGEIQIRVSGLHSPVIPSQESHAIIQVFADGEPVLDTALLELLNVRAWLTGDRGRKALPIERVGDQFRAYFVNLADGSYELETSVVAPTFNRSTAVPFVVANPLRVEVRPHDPNNVAWVSLAHPEVDYRTVRVSARVRKPPESAVIVPAQRQPAGLFELAVPKHEGVVELVFSVNGNYLDGRGFFLKTQRQTVIFPLDEAEVFRFDATGKRLNEPETMELEALLEPEPPLINAAPPQNGEVAVDVAVPQLELGPKEDSAPQIPLWFIAVISVLNLGVGLALWWLFKPAAINFELRAAEESGEDSAPAETASEPQTDDSTAQAQAA